MFVLQDESFPWESKYDNSFTITKQRIVQEFVGHNVITYMLNPNNIIYSYDEVNFINIIDSENISYFLDKQLHNVYLYVDDVDSLFKNFLSIYNNINGWISFKVSKDIDLKKLENQLVYISDFNKQLLQSNVYLPINEFEEYCFDKNFKMIKNNFDIVGNPYYFENKISNVLYPSFKSNEIKYKNDFIPLHNIFSKFKIDFKIYSISDLIKFNIAQKNQMIQEQVFLSRRKNVL